MSTGAGADNVAALGTMTSSWASALPGAYPTLGVTANRDANVAAHASGSDCPEAPEACAWTAWDPAAAINKAPTASLARGKALERDMGRQSYRGAGRPILHVVVPRTARGIAYCMTKSYSTLSYY